MGESFVDLDEETRRALDFDGMLEVVSEFAVTEEGRLRIRRLRPSGALGRVREELAAVGDCAREIAAKGLLIAAGLPDPRPALAAVAIEGGRASPLELRDLAQVLLEAARVRTRLARPGDPPGPRLRAIGERLADLTREAAPILEGVEPDGRIADGASPALGRLRREIGETAEAIRRRLEGILRDPGTGSAIQDEFVTERGGRFVIPVRSDRARSVRGIVHGVSSSGATLFVEPYETVDLNNELVRLREEEQDEQERIVRSWIGRLRDRRSEVERTVDGWFELDGLQARARFARDTGATLPDLDEGGPLVLEQVRHPLLDRRLRAGGGRAVPFDLRLEPFDRVLVLSGPNAGGKTVVLKTVGLSVLLAHSAIPVPAQRARIPRYGQVRADGGDRQSIADDLSTFTARIETLSSLLGGLAPPALVLLDEIGTGTEPVEGACLARAVLERLRSPGVTVVATTHFEALKVWASTSEGVSSAAMEFDERGLRPTFRLVADSAGRSAGLAIAERVGLDRALIERAQSLLRNASSSSEAELARLQALRREAEHQRRDLDRLRAEMEAERGRMGREIEEEVRRLRGAMEEGIEEAVRAFRDLARREWERAREGSERRALERRASRAEQRLRARAVEEAVRRFPEIGRGERSPSGSPPATLAPGTRVRVAGLDREGEILRVSGDRVELQFGSVRFSANRSDLLAAHGDRREPAEGNGARSAAGSTDSIEARREAAELRGEPSRELLLVGRTAAEAIEEADRFLDRAVLDGHREVRLIHGYGSGRLRAAIRRHLAGHPHVASFRPGSPGEGGEGATVVRLR